jgi:3-dehydroquinate synthase
MLLAARLSQRLGLLAAEEVKRLAAVLQAAGLPLEPPALDTERFLDLMGHDKKVEGGRIRFVLLKRIGEAFVSGEVPHAALVEVLGAGKAHAGA